MRQYASIYDGGLRAAVGPGSGNDREVTVFGADGLEASKIHVPTMPRSLVASHQRSELALKRPSRPTKPKLSYRHHFVRVSAGR